MKKCSPLFRIFFFISREGISSLIQIIIPPPLRLRSNQQGSQKPCQKNCAAGKFSSSLVSDIINTLMLQLTIVNSCTNLFLKELMLSCQIMRRFMLFTLISFGKDCESFSSVPFEFVRGNYIMHPSCLELYLILIWVGFLRVRFQGSGVGITPCLKLVRIMLES